MDYSTIEDPQPLLMALSEDREVIKTRDREGDTFYVPFHHPEFNFFKKLLEEMNRSETIEIGSFQESGPSGPKYLWIRKHPV
jgi:hypothetical protein